MDERPVMRVPELADILGVSGKRTYQMIAEGKVPGIIRLGRRVLLSRAVIERWLLGENERPEMEGHSRTVATSRPKR